MRPEMLADALAGTIRALHTPIALRLAALEELRAADLTAIETRLGQLEARAPIPGPQGEPGPEGPPGPAGRDGVDGKSLNYLGVYVEGKTYDAGDLVTDHGSVFYCKRTTAARPGLADWQLMVKRGQDGKGAR